MGEGGLEHARIVMLCANCYAMCKFITCFGMMEHKEGSIKSYFSLNDYIHRQKLAVFVN